MYKADDILKFFDITAEIIEDSYRGGLIQSSTECTKEEIFKILCSRCLLESGASPSQIEMILSAVHPSRQLNVGIYIPQEGMLTVFYVPHSNTDQRRYALDEIWKIQSKSRVSVVINFEKIMNDIEGALGAFEIKG